MPQGLVNNIEITIKDVTFSSFAYYNMLRGLTFG